MSFRIRFALIITKLCVSVWIRAQECTAPTESGRECRSLEAGVTRSYEPQDMGTGNRTHILCKGSVLVTFTNLTQTRVTWKEGTSLGAPVVGTILE